MKFFPCLSSEAYGKNGGKQMQLRKVGVVLLALLLAAMAMVPMVSAESNTVSEKKIVSDSLSADEKIKITPEEQKFVLIAIEASDLSAEEKEALVKKLKDIWSNNSTLSEKELQTVIHEVSLIVFDYYDIDTSDVALKWGGADGYNPDGTHNALAEIAGQKMGLSSTYTYILNENSKVPDTWGAGQTDQHYSWGGAPYQCLYYASSARDFIQSGDLSNGYRVLAYSMHFMDDVANPWHTQPLWSQGNHNAYEFDFVQMNFGTMFKPTLQGTSSYWNYYITNPQTSANSMASTSSGYYSYINNKINSDPTGWKNDYWVQEDTKTLLKEALRYNEGLIDYATR